MLHADRERRSCTPNPGNGGSARAHNRGMGESDVVGGVVLRITSALRQAGVPVSTGEAIDAAHALEVMDAAQRGQVRAALRATLIKRQDDVDTFERTFEALTGTYPDDPAPEGARPAGAPAATTEVSHPIRDGVTTRLLDDLVSALRDDDAETLRALATLAVDQFGGPALTSTDSERALLYRVLRGLDLARILQRALRENATDTEESG